ncbi:MAG: NRDE family protein [Myxococcaceae bacterium]
MCTLAVDFRPDAEWPLVIAANRDERLDRPASPPRLWPGPVPFLAPCDESAGGSWLGLNARGLFAGITNRFGASRDGGRESRGTLVIEALGHQSAEALHRALGGLSAARFNAFHLLYADRQAAFVTWSDGSTVQQQTLAPGLHVVTERSLGGDDRARSELVKERWSRLDGRYPPDPVALQALLSVHAEDVLGGTCVHAPAFGYGTRSSMVLFLARELSRSELRWAEGPPCITPFQELSDQVSALTSA